jgi:hypothetical protein
VLNVFSHVTFILRDQHGYVEAKTCKLWKQEEEDEDKEDKEDERRL